jgi:predicted Rossmann fold flavoprotein
MKNGNIVIIGAGPAGMMAAIAAASGGCRVILVEKNTSCGKKLLLTGNGRCNFTNSGDLERFLSAYGKNGPFLRDAFKLLFNNDLIKFFEARGVKIKTEENGRVFPSDDKASSVLKTLEDELTVRGVTVIKGSPLAEICAEPGRVSAVKLGNGRSLTCRAVILATGGTSYPSTGSTGEGHKMAKVLGHTVVPLRPGLVSLSVKEKYPSALTGLSLSGIGASISSGKRKFSPVKGDIIFTARGLSGPLIFSLSGVASDLISKGKPVLLSLDLFPDMSKDEVLGVISRVIDDNPSRTGKKCLRPFFPERLADLLIEISGIDKLKPANQITQKERSSISLLCKEFKLTVNGTSGMKEAMVTRGGISLKEIDPKTMASRIVRGLYFAGEIMDIDGDTGGFNLQAAFSTGYLAGSSARAL